MEQNCYASISDTGLHCAWCVTRKVKIDNVEMTQSFCEKHNKPCEEMGYYCHFFIGYKPDYRLTDEEEQQIVNKLKKL